MALIEALADLAYRFLTKQAAAEGLYIACRSRGDETGGGNQGETGHLPGDGGDFRPGP